MNTTLFITGVLSCFILMLALTQAFTLSSKDNDAEHRLLVERPLALSPAKFLSVYQDEGALGDNSEEDDDHELEKRRFNAWAGKRSLFSKRRFNAWAGRR